VIFSTLFGGGHTFIIHSAGLGRWHPCRALCRRIPDVGEVWLTRDEGNRSTAMVPPADFTQAAATIEV
jgi:hypothetical protein